MADSSELPPRADSPELPPLPAAPGRAGAALEERFAWLCQAPRAVGAALRALLPALLPAAFAAAADADADANEDEDEDEGGAALARPLAAFRVQLELWYRQQTPRGAALFAHEPWLGELLCDLLRWPWPRLLRAEGLGTTVDLAGGLLLFAMRLLTHGERVGFLRHGYLLEIVGRAAHGLPRPPAAARLSPCWAWWPIVARASLFRRVLQLLALEPAFAADAATFNYYLEQLGSLVGAVANQWVVFCVRGAGADALGARDRHVYRRLALDVWALVGALRAAPQYARAACAQGKHSIFARQTRLLERLVAADFPADARRVAQWHDAAQSPFARRRRAASGPAGAAGAAQRAAKKTRAVKPD